jgi:hypothetical protein
VSTDRIAAADLTGVKPGLRKLPTGDGGHEKLPGDGQMTARWRT